MNLEAKRLSALIEFCHQSARLRGKPTANISSHGNFSLYENDLNAVPSVKINPNGQDDSDDIWLSVKRQHETKPPEVINEWLTPWIVINRGPNEEPELKSDITGNDLIDAGTHTDDDDSSELLFIDSEAIVRFDEYSERSRVKALHQDYVKNKWIPWSTEEKKRLKAIRLYSQLFTLKQQLEGGIVETQLELAWGIGIGIRKTSNTIVSYPLISQLVELSLNPLSSALEVRPRNVNPKIELDWYAAEDNPGVADLEKAAKSFFETLPNTLSPFDSSTYEPLLRSAVTHLDANGVYWPSQIKSEDRTLPQPDDKLKVTDTWVLFARPRTNSTYIEDLERLKAEVEDLKVFPPAVSAIVTAPDTANPEVKLPAFRGISASYHVDGSNNESKPPSHEAKDLYFPKPFNDEQVRIIQLLEIFDGVVAQGPPGTGKTHTIANVICHFLANGKRVLVTSMKDPALSVLTDQLPNDIKPLAVSLLTSEQEGMKKFEHSIQKIASEVQSIDRSATSKEIQHLEESINILHGKLAHVDWNISLWAKKNLSKITIDSIELDSTDAAHELVTNQGSFEWIPDPINIDAKFAPRFSDQDIRELRVARTELGKDILYLGASLPQLVEFPESKSILQTHQDLSHFEQLKIEVDKGNVPSLIDTSQSTIDSAIILNVLLDDLRKLRISLSKTGYTWIEAVKIQLSDPRKKDIQQFLNNLGEELKDSKEKRNDFFSRPVIVPDTLEINNELVGAVNNLAEGKRPFGLSGLMGKTAEKKAIESIRILGNPARSTDDWKHIKAYLSLQSQLREQVIRWNALADELQLPQLDTTPQGGLEAIELLNIYEELKSELILEQQISQRAKIIFTSWDRIANVIADQNTFDELGRALRHHLTKNRLANVWSYKEQFHKILDGRSGLIVEDIKTFINQTLGNPTISDSDMQVAWSLLMAELSRVLALGAKLDTVQKVSDLVIESGAPEYAALLRQPTTSSTADDLLPSNLKLCWRLKRLDTHLNEIDAQAKIKQLSKQRTAIETDLSRAYQDIVIKRTWLKLAENASPSIRAALQAYLSAIQKIGKGTGKRAVRYRQDARNAASYANSAVPCWIMPHYRISESLPAKIGCFDLVIIDEASQSDLTALPALLRAKKVLIVGDDKQVSPEGVGLEEEKIRSLMTRFLSTQVETYRPQMSPERSIYDLFKVVFAKSSVMLKEHFRCVGPIIEYSKREFYNHELRPLRLPKASERLDPPLIDVLLQDGYRNGDSNLAEARFIVEEIKRMVIDNHFYNKSIGVVSLLGDKQAYLIWNMLTEEIGPAYLHRHKIACGDARTFQGKEKDVIFLSMVVARSQKERITALSRDTYAQRFNVAASRARDRMYLVRSVGLEHLSSADNLRRNLINHFTTPYTQDENIQEDLRRLCESQFECEVYDALTERGYWVTPQVKVGQFRIDMVVEGNNDTRLAIECDGDRYHGPDKWSEDMHRQRILERAGWVFWRCFASNWIRHKNEMIDDLLRSLSEYGIDPLGSEMAPKSIHTEQRVLVASALGVLDLSTISEGQEKTPSFDITYQDDDDSESQPEKELVIIDEPNNLVSHTPKITQTANEPEFVVPASVSNVIVKSSTINNIPELRRPKVKKYIEFNEPLTGDPRMVNIKWVSKNLLKIITVEGPVIAKRACDIYLRAVGIKRMGHEIKAIMVKALKIAIDAGEVEYIKEVDGNDIMDYTMRPSGTELLVIRTRGNRTFEEITPGEVQFIAKSIAQKRKLIVGSDEHLRAIMVFYDLKRLTTQFIYLTNDILKRELQHVDAALDNNIELVKW